MIDILIKNATIVDGTGKEGYTSDLAIKDGKIIEIAESLNYDSCKVEIDGINKIIAPGFIDVHGHTDLFGFVDPTCTAKLKQGITTELAGQCGFTLAPVKDEHWAEFYQYFKSLGAPINEQFKKYTTMNSYMEMLENLPLGINLGMFTGHGTLRIAAMGLSPQEPTDEQLQEMKDMLRESMVSGSFGLSSGLMYAPGSFAKGEELTELCKVVAEYSGVYTSHLKNQGNSLQECVADTIAHGIKSGVAVNISHHKAVGKSNWGKVTETCKLIDLANDMGVEATHDLYPYIASSTTLSGTLPPSYLKDGVETFLMNLQNEDYQEKLEDSIFNPQEDWDNDLKENGYDSLLIIRAPQTPEAVGKTITEYAEYLGKTKFKTYIHLLIENKLDVSDICFSMAEKDIEHLIKHPKSMFCTDSLYIPGMPMVHPRSLGSFPRIIGRYVREKNMLSLETAIYKMTGYAAEVYGIKNKGYLKPNYDADIVIFDKEKIIDKSTFSNPIQDNEGIDYVIVNGVIAINNGEPTNARAGKVLRKTVVS